uniref:Uncharacterized protein n=1 Tax=Arundo donax TaxID=35708 RepID=A0A0A9G1B5_ARUDO
MYAPIIHASRNKSRETVILTPDIQEEGQFSHKSQQNQSPGCSDTNKQKTPSLHHKLKVKQHTRALDRIEQRKRRNRAPIENIAS